MKSSRKSIFLPINCTEINLVSEQQVDITANDDL